MLDKRYRIVALLGRGGMGEVYRADDLKLGQPVALKFLPGGFERDERRLSRLLSEVKNARQVSHANVCRVYDVGEADGQHYLSMEYVDGEDLVSLLRRIGRLPQEKALQVARQICAGVGAAHEQGILHRDLKPANVMIDGRGRVKVPKRTSTRVSDTTRTARPPTVSRARSSRRCCSRRSAGRAPDVGTARPPHGDAVSRTSTRPPRHRMVIASAIILAIPEADASPV